MPFDMAQATESLVRIRADISRTSPVRVTAVSPQKIGSASSGRIDSFDFNFELRRVVGAMIDISEFRPAPAAIYNTPMREHVWGRLMQNLVWVEYGELRPRYGRGTVDNSFQYYSLNHHSDDSFRRSLESSSRVHDIETKKGISLWDRETQLIQIRLNPGHSISVRDYGNLNEDILGAGNDSKSGEVWWLDFVAETGQLVSAYMQQSHSGAMIQIPFDDLDYDAGLKCFVLRNLPTISRTPMFPGGVAYGISNNPKDVGVSNR
jgi:hypothetical protein